MPTNCLASTLASLTFGPERSFENLTMLPLMRGRMAGEPTAARAPHSELDYEVLDVALASGLVEVTEVSRHGSVPELRVVNVGEKPVLIVDGEELVGARQNRVVNLTILVPAHSHLTIPVSCVEAGRWRARSRTFASAPRTQYAAGRAKRMSQVTACMMDAGAYHADQADVWKDIADKSARLGANSPTSAMEAMFTDHAPKLDSFVHALPPLDGQVGALFAVSDRNVCIDLFDRPETFRKVLPKLVRSVAIDAIDAALAGDSIPDRPGQRPDRGPGLPGLTPLFIAALSSASAHVTPAVGLGEDVRLTAHGLTGAALVAEGTVVHLSGFAV